MNLRKLCAAVVLVVLASTLLPAPASALPTSESYAQVGRTWFVSFAWTQSWVNDIVESLWSGFVSAQGATITGNGGSGG
jgi:hypothetical protein